MLLVCFFYEKIRKNEKIIKKLLHFYFFYDRIPMYIMLTRAGNNMKGSEIMVVIEYVLLVLLLIAAAFIVVAVILQKSNEDGLSGTIAGGSETFYGKDKSSNTDRALYKWTLVAGIIFAVAVLAVFIIQPDYAKAYTYDWTNSNINQYSNLFTK